MSVRIAIVLCGCGRADGSEVTEAVSTLVHASRLGAHALCFAPHEAQASVVNHLTGEDAGGTRNMLEEAARIARGKIAPLSELHAASADALVFPGGFGAAKNLCDFASRGAACTVHPQVERVVKEFHDAKKPLGFICIAPIIAAKVLGSPAGAAPGKQGPAPCTLTLGPEAPAGGDAPAAARAMGARTRDVPVTQCVVDEASRIVTTPAYMCDATPFEVFTGIGSLMEAIVRLATHR